MACELQIRVELREMQLDATQMLQRAIVVQLEAPVVQRVGQRCANT